ncbi:MAG: DUF1572 family protein [Deinococcales bacterium]
MAQDLLQTVLDELKAAYRAQKALGDGALRQLEDADVLLRPDPDSNSVAVLAKHLRGNMLSRWTDFLSSDGEKPERRRDDEFEVDAATADEVRSWWEEGWSVALAELERLQPDDLAREVRIRGEPHSVPRALLRQLTHTAQHVGQIVLLAKHARGERWVTLSIPKNGTAAFNRGMGFEPDPPR